MRPKSYMDDDGVALGKRIPIRVKVEVAGDRMKVDLVGRVEAGRGLLQFRRNRGPRRAARWRSNA